MIVFVQTKQSDCKLIGKVKLQDNIVVNYFSNYLVKV